MASGPVAVKVQPRIGDLRKSMEELAIRNRGNAKIDESHLIRGDKRST